MLVERRWEADDDRLDPPHGIPRGRRAHQSVGHERGKPLGGDVLDVQLAANSACRPWTAPRPGRVPRHRLRRAWWRAAIRRIPFRSRRFAACGRSQAAGGAGSAHRPAMGGSWPMSCWRASRGLRAWPKKCGCGGGWRSPPRAPWRRGGRCSRWSITAAAGCTGARRPRRGGAGRHRRFDQRAASPA